MEETDSKGKSVILRKSFRWEREGDLGRKTRGLRSRAGDTGEQGGFPGPGCTVVGRYHVSLPHPGPVLESSSYVSLRS